MEYYDFGNPTGHPEVEDSQEALIPASETTKAAIVEAVNTKISKSDKKFTWRQRKLQRPNHFAETIIVTKFNEQARRNTANEVVKISINLDSPDQSDPITTSYTVTDSPDGLQVSRQIKYQEPIKPFRSLPELFVAIETGSNINSRNKFRAESELDSLENELGLTFVSEIEAAEVLAMVDQAQPIL